MKIFISGPITGKNNYNRSAFATAEGMLSDQGHTVLNPSNHTPIVDPESITHAAYLNICKAMIDCCDAIYMLNGWQDSKGANIERDYAMLYDKKILYQEDEDDDYPSCSKQYNAVDGTCELCTSENDSVEHPSHYTQGGIECIDAIASAVTGLTGMEAVCTGHIIRYIWRWKNKNGVEDLRKCRYYLLRLIEEAKK